MTGPATPDRLVLRAPRLLDGTGAPPVEAAALLIAGGRVAYAGPAAGLPEGAAGAATLDFPAATLLPGLVDAHVHLVASGHPDLAAGLPKSEAERTIAAVVNARRQLESGVTLVRDLGAPGDEAVQVGRAVEAGTIAGPRVVAAGPAVTMTGGHIPYLGRVTDGPDAMRAAVRANLAMGARCIKVVATGGVLTPGVDPREPAYTQPELDALVSEAHRFGLTVAAHAIGEGGVAAALRAGVDSVEHGMFLDAAAIELFLATGARLSATFSAPSGILGGPSVPEWIKDRARPAAEAQVRSFRAAVQAGVPAAPPTTPTAAWPARSPSWSMPAWTSWRPSGRPPARPPTCWAWPTGASCARAPPPTCWSPAATWPPTWPPWGGPWPCSRTAGGWSRLDTVSVAEVVPR
jgi:imidazolonepropionase-like amidohydrolase